MHSQVFTEVGAAHSGSSSDDAGLDSIAAMKKVSVVVAVVAMLLLIFVFFWLPQVEEALASSVKEKK